MEPEHISEGLFEVLQRPERQRQLQENTRTWVQSLIQEGRTHEAKVIAFKERGTLRNELCLLIAPMPTGQACCEKGHPVEWQFNFFTSKLPDWLTSSCQECEKEQERFERRPYRHRPSEELAEALLKIGMPKRYLDATVKKLEGLTESLFLSGQRGTGKTHMAAAMIREIMVDKRPEQGQAGIRWVSAVDLLLEIRGSFRDGSERAEGDIIEDYSECTLLVLDDLGAEKTTEWSLQTLYTIIDRRYREERQTIITSNLSLDELADKLDDRIASRLSELCRVVVLTGPDRRIQKKRTQPQG